MYQVEREKELHSYFSANTGTMSFLLNIIPLQKIEKKITVLLFTLLNLARNPKMR